MVDFVSPAQARRIALSAQGFGVAPPPSVGTRQINSLVRRMGLLQVDSVNVFERSHYLPVFARLGAYDKALLDRLTFGAKAQYVETWGHVASIVPLETWPLWRWKMRAFKAKHLGTPDHWTTQNGPMLDWLRGELAATGPIAASRIEHDANKSKGAWWGWSDVKLGLEYLFLWGEVVPAGRKNFERIYGLAEQVLPRELLDIEVSERDAHKQLLSLAAQHHGIGTLGDLADYYRLKKTPAKAVAQELIDEGELLPVTVDGWGKPAFLHRDARIPRRLEATALLSPFDPVVWERDRALRMFDFHYRIEIYTPEPKRIYGYYTLPLLIDDRVVGRIDLKNDRQNRVLRVQSAWLEPGAPAGVEQRVVPLLESIRDWQGLDSISVVDRGDFAPALRGVLGARGR
ncbi:winged helix-turn-helix domain-containing protein [Glaciihabitans arcticus]|uniref:Winged helix-turn-helix domain-containing protein n=1 Tax=Glaciihabitans arcticus TaxID=2668039 RepID=A0A4Q9GS58_9MICO|nr:crosslink repair DNA glycosylase YcaQ family protein [Glaciihabitans arcticus]TBN57405.1 winged helix-turn-helix domain-containing protein [Glaciihabitans arcticus]